MVPATAAKEPAISQVTITTRCGSIPDSRARSSLSEYARMALPVRVRIKNR